MKCARKSHHLRCSSSSQYEDRFLIHEDQQDHVNANHTCERLLRHRSPLGCRYVQSKGKMSGEGQGECIDSSHRKVATKAFDCDFELVCCISMSKKTKNHTQIEYRLGSLSLNFGTFVSSYTNL